MTMLFLTTPRSYKTADDTTGLGIMTSPATGAVIPEGVPWGVDSGCYSTGYPGDVQYLNWLATRPLYIRSACLFATAPDVPCEHEPTLIRSIPFFPIIQQLGYPVSFVAQNGAVPDNVPWASFDVLFLGGTTDWKLGREAAYLTVHAIRLGVPVHMGRVNSSKRFQYAQEIGCTSSDGTAAAYDPATMAVQIAEWITPRQHTCESCGNIFYPSRRDAITCSPSCRQAKSRATRAAGGGGAAGPSTRSLL